MQDVTTIEGQLALEARANIAVVCSRFNHFIVDALEAGCLDALRRHGGAGADVTVVRTPGAFEMPVVARKLAASG